MAFAELFHTDGNSRRTARTRNILRFIILLLLIGVKSASDLSPDFHLVGGHFDRHAAAHHFHLEN